MEHYELIKLNDKVRVSKTLTVDPYNKRGKIGLVIAFDLEKWFYVLEFKDGSTGIYSYDAVELVPNI